MTLHIKNMVCLRCKMTVESELKRLGFDPLSIELGEVDFKQNLLPEEIEKIGNAFQMGYSHVAYLSNQFKKITGLTPTYFKVMKDNKRQSIEKV